MCTDMGDYFLRLFFIIFFALPQSGFPTKWKKADERKL